MRVAIDGSGLAPGTSAGIEKFTYRLVESLCAAGPTDQFELLIPSRTRTEWLARVSAAPNMRLHEVMTPATVRAATHASGAGSSRARVVNALRRNGAARRSAYAWKRRQRRRALAALRPDVLYLPTDVGGCPESRSIGGAQIVVTMHDLRIVSDELGDSLFAAAHAQCVERAAAVITSWDEPRAEILQRYPALGPRLFMVSFPSLLPATEGPSETRDQPFLLYPASTLPHKNHVRLVHALSEVRKRHDVRLVCTGPLVEPGAGALRREIRELGLEDRVELLGFVTDDELRALFRGCAGVVVPTLWEAASGAIMEGLDFGRPICCSDIDSLRRQVADSRARVSFFDALDVGDMARAMLAMLDDPDRYTGTDPNAGDNPPARLPTWAEVGHAYLEVFRWVAAGSNPQARPFDRVGLGTVPR